MPSNAEAINHMAYTPCHATSRPALLSVRSPPSIRHRGSGLARSCQQRYATPLRSAAPPSDRSAILLSIPSDTTRRDARYTRCGIRGSKIASICRVILAQRSNSSMRFGIVRKNATNLPTRNDILRRYRVAFYSIIRRSGMPSDTSSSFAYLSASNQRCTHDALVGEIRHLPDDYSRRGNR